MTVQDKRRKLKEILLRNECTPAIGVTDVISARIVEKQGYEIAYLGSYSTAAFTYGIPDTDALGLEDMAAPARNIAPEIDIPMICDAENGFFNAANIWRTVRTFEDTGVAAIHIEDHVFGKHTNLPPVILDVGKMCDKIRAAVDARRDRDFIIIARTDCAWAIGYDKGGIEESIRRCNLFMEAGADAVFGAYAQTPEQRKQVNGPIVNPSNLHDSVAFNTKVGINVVLFWPFSTYASFVGMTEACKIFRENGFDYAKMGKYQHSEEVFNEYVRFPEYVERAQKYRI